MSDIVERLRQACNGHPAAKIPWPHRVLHEAAATIEALRKERDEALAKVALATDPAYLQSAIEKVGMVDAEWQARAIAAEKREAVMREALEYAAMGLGRVHASLSSNGPKQASGEMAAHFLDRARTALAHKGPDNV
jgi:hypothetical protein